MLYQAHQSALVARTVLAVNRPIGGEEAVPRAVDMLRNHSARAWYDPMHRFSAGAATAYRAIDDGGHFCWLVEGSERSATLSREANPYDAIEETRREPAIPDVPWDEVRRLGRALRNGEIRFHLVAADFRDLPPAYRCLGDVGMPGWIAGWLLTVMPQIGAAIWSAHRRTLIARRGRPTVLPAA